MKLFTDTVEKSQQRRTSQSGEKAATLQCCIAQARRQQLPRISFRSKISTLVDEDGQDGVDGLGGRGLGHGQGGEDQEGIRRLSDSPRQTRRMYQTVSLNQHQICEQYILVGKQAKPLILAITLLKCVSIFTSISLKSYLGPNILTQPMHLLRFANSFSPPFLPFRNNWIRQGDLASS